MKALLVVLLVTSLALAGCGDAKKKGGGGEEDLKSGKGAISGLVINDVYRPVPNALVLLSNGETATSDSSGQFEILDLDPGAYIARIQADGHEAAPQAIDVVEGQYAEAELIARRIFNDGGRIITTEYSVFISCAADFVVNGIVYDCTLDQSGDTDRAQFTSNYTGYAAATYLVTEMKANHAGRYEVQVRCGDTPRDHDGDGETDSEYYAVARIDGDYARMVMPLGQNSTTSPVPPEYGGSFPWLNDCTMQTILFTDSAGREEIQEVFPDNPVYEPCCGVGMQFGIRARFVQSLFLGEPEVDIDSYGVLG